MAELLVEFYLSQTDREAAAAGAEGARLAAEKLTRRGTPVRYPSSIVVPEDETCFVEAVPNTVATDALSGRAAREE